MSDRILRPTLRVAISLAFFVNGREIARAAPPVPAKEWVPVGRLDAEVVREASGIVKSRRHPGIFWTHGDSGTPASLYAFRESGEIVATVPLAKAPNTDWEDIAADAAGNLYVGDIGNNLGLFPSRYVYVVSEPDPEGDRTEPAPWTRRWKYKYPGARFNSECLFIHHEQLHIISIGRGERPTVYRLEPQSDDECGLVTVAALPVYFAQGADASPDGKRLAVCTSGSLWVIDTDERAAPVPDRRPQQVHFPPCRAEACCFDGDDVIILTEAGLIYRVDDSDIRAGTTFTLPNPEPAPPTDGGES